LQSLSADVRITEIPKVKADIVLMQIHTSSKPQILAIMYRKIYNGIYILYNENFDTKDNPLAYSVGQRLHIDVNVNNSIVNCQVINLDTNKNISMVFTTPFLDGAFQIGSYTLTNIFKGEKPSDGGEVRVKNLSVTETYEGVTKHY